ncbi:MAG: peptidase T4 [Alphaproteobacteria bacterium]|nr:peptidase T4 [Alphaproteobacteria bacterium]
MRPGPRNLITDVEGLTVGHAADARAWTGTTVILPRDRAVASVATFGGAPGTRETDALQPETLVEAVDAIVLSGGSVFGLAAADGVVAWLAEQGRGFAIGGVRAPVVPAAILFDLTNGGEKEWGAEPPYRALGRAAVAAAASDHALGNAGAGFGARAGAYKGGLGSVSVADEGFTVGALIAANPFGSPVMPGTGTLWAFALEQQRELGHQHPPAPVTDALRAAFPADVKGAPVAGTNTTIGVVATDATLTPAEAKRLAIMGQSGLARAVRPIHTPFDGDVIFALATGARPLPEPRAATLLRLGHMAADCTARALARGVFEARALGPWQAYRDVHRASFGV